MAEPEATHAPPLVADRYRLLRRLGEGGMGQVWLAHDDGLLDRDVAVKEVRLAADLSETARTERIERAVREARNAAKVSHHPNVVTVHDIVVHDGAPWIVMEYVQARDLGRVVAEDGPLTPREAARIATAVVNALAASHAAGIVHRDVKPANILIAAADGHVLLTDFGIAVQEADTTMTATGVLVATPEYVAPERARGAAAGPASDYFSLGATIYEALEGTSPFRRETGIATLTALLMDEPAYPAHAGPLAPLLYDLLRKDPTLRPGAQETRRQLGEVLAQGPAVGPVAPTLTAAATAPHPATSPTNTPVPPTVVAWPPAPAQHPATPAASPPTPLGQGVRPGRRHWSPLGLVVQVVVTVLVAESASSGLAWVALIVSFVSAACVWTAVAVRRRRI